MRDNIYLDFEDRKYLFPKNGHFYSRHFDDLDKIDEREIDENATYKVIGSYKNKGSSIEFVDYHLIPEEVYNSENFRNKIAARNPSGFVYDAVQIANDSEFACEINKFCLENKEVVLTTTSGDALAIYSPKKFKLTFKNVGFAIAMIVFAYFALKVIYVY